MAGLVRCPNCDWRGFRAYYPRHREESHAREPFSHPVKVDLNGLDSQPRGATPLAGVGELSSTVYKKFKSISGLIGSQSETKAQR